MSNEKDKKDSPMKTFSQNKVFVMTRPSEGEEHLSIATEEFNKLEGDLAELYHVVFFDYLLNLSGEISVKQHKVILAQIIAPIAYQFFLVHPEKAHGVVQNSLAQLKAQKVNTDFIKKMPDEVSMLDYILRHNLYRFLEESKGGDLDVALEEYQEFLTDLEEVFFSLPAAFCFGVVEAVSILGEKPKPTSKKKKNKKTS
jgi:hypothetical protein